MVDERQVDAQMESWTERLLALRREFGLDRLGDGGLDPLREVALQRRVEDLLDELRDQAHDRVREQGLGL